MESNEQNELTNKVRPEQGGVEQTDTPRRGVSIRKINQRTYVLICTAHGHGPERGEDLGGGVGGGGWKGGMGAIHNTTNNEK